MVIDPGNNIPSASSSAGKARQPVPARQPADNNGQSETGKSTDSVSLSSRGQSLAKVEAEIAKAPDVDTAKVERMKAAISSGQYQVNADAVAEKMLGSDLNFL